MRFIFALALCLSLVIFAGVGYPQSDEICCTWVNTEYEAGEQPQKMIFNYDGTFETYEKKNALDPIMRGIFQIDHKWTDTDGIIWYKVKMIDMYGTKHNLVRISKQGDDLEFVRQPHDYPETIDTKASSYRIYHRTLMK